MFGFHIGCQRVMHIVFRADANNEVGMGHIMRCLSIADSFSSMQHSISFILADDGVKNLVRDRGYNAFILNTDFRDMKSELDHWPNIQCDVVLVDSYYVTYDFLVQLQERIHAINGKLVYIDDVYSFPYPVDILVNYNVYGNDVDYEGLYSDKELPSFILGITYAPLRAMFRGILKRVQPNRVKSILVSTGGSDELHIAMSMVRALVDGVPSSCCYGIKDIVFHFLVGALNSDKKAICEIVGNRQNIILHEGVEDMKSLIQSCDLAISAAGSTMYEISACGVPVVTYSLADNQIQGAEAFERLGLAVYVGDLREKTSIRTSVVVSGKLKNNSFEILLSAVHSLANDYDRRSSMGKRMQEMIDGYGADRMVREIIRIANRKETK